MIELSIKAVQRIAQDRPAGYLADVMDRGHVAGSSILLSEEDYEALRLKYSPRGMGDRLARFLKPVAVAIDATFGTHIETCAGCADRQRALNDLSSNL